MTPVPELPVHSSLRVLQYEDVYKNNDWWKAVVRYEFQEDDYSEVAVYLWNREGDKWTRKNKYVIKTIDAWKTDKSLINRLFSKGKSPNYDEDFPINDYYEVVDGKTVFKSEDWWKAVVMIGKKGTYETEEVMVYLWQKVDGEWKRRQKYTIKSPERWVEESKVIESVLDIDVEATTTSEDPAGASAKLDKHTLETNELDELARALETHLSEHSSNPEP